jgi:hypothetical protein
MGIVDLMRAATPQPCPAQAAAGFKQLDEEREVVRRIPQVLRTLQGFAANPIGSTGRDWRNRGGTDHRGAA